MGEIRTALEDILESPLGASELRDLKEVVAELDRMAWSVNGASSAGIMVGLLAGLQAGVAEGRIRAVRGRMGRRAALLRRAA